MKAILVCQGRRLESVVAVVVVNDADHDAKVAELRAADPEGEWFTTRTLTVETVAQVVEFFAEEKRVLAEELAQEEGN